MKCIKNLDKRNKNIVITVVIAMIIVLVYLAVILVFADNRKDMTQIDILTFDNCIMEINENKRLKWDKDDEKAVIPLEFVYVIGTDKEFDVEIRNQDNKDLKANLIEEQTKEDGVGSDVFITDYRVEFDMPKDTYYIKLTVSKDGISQEISIDYRYFKKT